MARSIRIEYGGAFYHVMARGNRRERIFFDDEDRRFFLEALGRACARTGWRVHGWVLMSNHYHLAIETPEPNLVVGMQWLQNTFTRRFNVRHRKWGRVFGDRYKAIVIEGGSGYYYESLLDYIHLNPVRVGLVRARKGESVLDFAWSSVAGGCALPGRRRPPWLAAAAVLRAFDCEDTVAGRRRFVERLDRRAVEEGAARAGVPLVEAEADARCSHLRRGWYWGKQAFAERVLALGQSAMRRQKGRAYRSTGARRSSEEAQAAQWLKEGLAAAELRTTDLEQIKGSDPRKVALARHLWERTTVSQGWLAKHLEMGSAANVSQQIRRSTLSPRPLPRGLKRFLESVKN
jgi:REP element-mobilizing transposase RayT